MKIIKRLILKNRIMKNNHGSTLVEMIVCFALMGIFMAAAAAIIAAITSLYFNIKGEIYSREVSDIIMEKITSELDGAEYFKSNSSKELNPKISSNSSIELCDKTDTHVTLEMDDTNGFKVHYHEIKYTITEGEEDKKNRSAIDWRFDEKMFNGFNITELKFYNCGTGEVANAVASEYGLPVVGAAGYNLSEYDSNIVLVLLKLHSGRYGDYTYYKFVKMYNLPSDYTWPQTNENT